MDNIVFVKSKNQWRFLKNKNKKYFNTQSEAISYKFIMILCHKTFWNISRDEY